MAMINDKGVHYIYRLLHACVYIYMYSREVGRDQHEYTMFISVGSAYRDWSIWRYGLVGEGLTSSSVLVVKSHNAVRMWTNQSINDPDQVN